MGSRYFRSKPPPVGGYSILVVDGGGRGYAIVWKLLTDRLTDLTIGKIFVAPGNAGTAVLPGVTNVDIAATDIPALLAFAKANNIYLTIVGPEDPLIDGIVDAFQEAGLRIFGPNKAAAKLEGDKSWAKNQMREAGVPTADYRVFTSYQEAIDWLFTQPVDKRWFVKASGPALGKGAIGCHNQAEAIHAVGRIMIDREFADAGDTIVIEEWLEGYEVSSLYVCSGKSAIALKPAKDYKREGVGDTGENTGGTGNACPHPRVSEAMVAEYLEKIVKPMLRQIGGATGVMFVGLMITAEGPMVLEFNMRFGDPETQVILALLESSLFDLLDAAVEGRLDEIEVEWENKKALAVALMSLGYPRKYVKGKKINLPETLPQGVTIDHGGTKTDTNGDLLTNGGRILYVVAVADSFEEAISIAYEVATQIEVEGGCHYRPDIGADCLMAA